MYTKSFHALGVAAVLMSSLSGCAAARGSEDCSVDMKIRTSVQDILDAHPEIAPPNAIHVQAIDRVVYLYGLVDTGAEKAMAETLVARTHGVTKVVNSIEQNN